MSKKQEAEFLIGSVLADAMMITGFGNTPISNTEETEQKLLEILKLNAGYDYNLEAMNLLIQVYIQTGKHEEAISYFEKLVSFATENDLVAVAELVTDTCTPLKLYKLGIRMYKTALAKLNHPKMQNGLGFFYGKAGQDELALQYTKAAVEAEPKNPLFLNDLGYTLFSMGRLEEAKDVYEKGAKLDPDYKRIRSNLKYCENALKMKNR